MTTIQNTLDDVNASLNPEQKLAAETTEGPVMVVAGAGAGKTKMLIHRVASLMVKGVPAANIMVVTFTNRAAGEIKDRLEQMIGENGQYVHAGTFHSIIFKQILKPYGHSQYLQGQNINMEECAILDEKEATSLLKDAFNELSETDQNIISENEWSLDDFKQILSIERSKGYDVFDFFSRIAPGSTSEAKNRIAASIWRSFNIKCRSVGGIDFDDILLHADKMLKKESGLAEELSRQFRYLMLDEYQDTNPVQMSIMDSIAKFHSNICVVGDEKQSIYAFRGADINVILTFQKRYPGAKLIDMNKNYRSYPEIIRYSNAIADAMQQKISSGMMKGERKITEDPHELSERKGNSVAIVEFPSEQLEAVNVVKAIMRDLTARVQGNKIAVLYRNRNLKIELERMLVDRNIPYKLVGDTSFFQRAEVKDAIALVRFIFNPWDSVAGLRVLKSTNMRVSDAAAKKSMQENGCNVHEYLRQQSELRLKSKKKDDKEYPFTETAKKVRPFINLCKMLKEACEYGDSPIFIRDILAQIWDIYMRPGIENKKDDNNTDIKIENVQHIFKRVKESMENGMDITSIIEDLAFMVDNNGENNSDEFDKVQLMTMHASKGLEFDNVYIIGLDAVTTHGEDPDENEIEESRRLFYVGATRAEKKLSISYSTERLHYGSHIEPEGSPFIGEIETRLKIRRVIVRKPEEKILTP
jgi:DNA helicase-2/ATP-dependent DNA helicase PcrA